MNEMVAMVKGFEGKTQEIEPSRYERSIPRVARCCPVSAAKGGTGARLSYIAASPSRLRS